MGPIISIARVRVRERLELRQWARPAAVRVTAATLAACAVGPDFVLPTVPSKANWSGASRGPGVDQRQDPAFAWWRTFKDPALNRLIDMSVAQNLDLQAAGLRIYQARAQLGVIIGDYFPQTQKVGAGYKRERVSKDVGLTREVSRFVDFDPTFQDWSTGFDASWEIDVWGKVARGVQAARANLVVAVADRYDLLVTITGDVATAYVTLRELQAEIALTRRSIIVQEDSLRLTQLQFREGTTTELDVDEATAFLNSTKAEVPNLEADLAKAKNALAVLIGRPAGDIDGLLKPNRGIPATSPHVGIGVPVELLRRRPDIRAAELRALEQAAKVGVAVADLYPQFGITGSVGVKASDLSTLFTSTAITGLINPGVSWNVLNYGRIRNNVRVEDARLQELLTSYRQQVLKAYAEAEDALTAFLKSKQQVVFLTRSVRASQRAQRISLLEYQAGTVSFNRVLDNQVSLLRSEQRLASVRADAVTNLVALYKALGGGWQSFTDAPLVPDETKVEMAARTNWGRLLDDDAIPEAARQLKPPPTPGAKPQLPQPDF